MRLGDVGHCLPSLPSPEISVRPTTTPPTIPSCPHHGGPRATQLQRPRVQGQRGHHASRGAELSFAKKSFATQLSKRGMGQGNGCRKKTLRWQLPGSPGPRCQVVLPGAPQTLHEPTVDPASYQSCFQLGSVSGD